LIGRHQDSDHANEKRKDGDVFEKKNARKTMTAPIIKTATESDEARVIDVMVLAFSMDPGARWTWPEPRQYLAHFREFVKALGGGAFSHKSAYYLEGYGGASLWLPPNVRENPR
jgi:hypothetical protein